MYSDLTEFQKKLFENAYSKLIEESRRRGKSTGQFKLAFSHKSGGFIVLSDKNANFHSAEENPNYEVIGTYRGIPTPRIDQVAGDMLAHFDEQETKTTGHRAGISANA